MSWEERLQPAAFTSPSGLRTVFKTENVSLEINKRDSIREFPDFQGAFVQNLGIGASSYPLTIYFSGEDHDLEADDFLNRLAEEGKGILEHLLYGRLENIVAVGSIKRRDDLKTAANQTVFQVNFVQSSAFQFPGSIQSINDQIDLDIDLFDRSQAAEFEEIEINTANENISLIDSLKANLNAAKQQLKKIAATVDSIQREFNDAFDFITDNIQILVGTPLLLANRIIEMVRLPSRASGQISRMLEGYQNLITDLTSQSNEPTLGNISKNKFQSTELFVNAAMSGLITASQSAGEASQENTGQSLTDFFRVSSDSTVFITKQDIINTVELLSAEFEKITAWNEANRSVLNIPDAGSSYYYLNKSLSDISAFLIQISFSSRQEIEFRLPAPRNFIELCAELYQVTDNAFDFFILTNKLNSDEIIEIPKNRLIRYYSEFRISS